MKKIIYLLILGVLMGFDVTAQDQGAINILTERAHNYYNSRNYFEAVDMYKKAYSKEKNKAAKAEILFKIGMCFFNMGDTKNAEQWYAKAIKVKYKNPEVYLYYGEVLKTNGNYAEATNQFALFSQEVPTDKRGEVGKKSCEMATKWVTKPSRFKVENASALNTKYADMATGYSAKEAKGIIFTSSREESMGSQSDYSWNGEKNTDLFETTSDKKGKWSIPVNLPVPVNSEAKEGPITMDRKYSDMYFTRCMEGKSGKVDCKIYNTKRTGPAVWSEPVALPFCAEDTMSFGHPTLSADESTLYFSSDKEGGMGGKDIWMSTLNKQTKTWSQPVNLGGPVNTPGDELFPFIHADGTLYFSSTGHHEEGNMGGLDIYSAKPSGAGKFVNITNLQSPINSNADDFGIIWEDLDTRGYFTSNREGGKGKDDIYSFLLPPLIFTVQGKVIDVDTRKPLADSKVDLTSTKDNNTISFTTDASGNYKFSLAVSTAYKMMASKKEYLGAQGEESTIGYEESKDFVRDFELKTTKKPIVLPNILYDLAKATLREESKAALDGLVETMNVNPTIVIELGSHTDTRASDEYNNTLSQARAQSVVDYLISKGIEAGRLVAKGYGETVPRILASTQSVTENGKEFSFKEGVTVTDNYINGLKGGKDEQEAAHQLNRRTEFRVLRDDYVPGSTPAAPVDVKIQQGADNTPPPVVEEKPVEAPVAETPVEPKKEEPKVEEPVNRFYTAVKGDTYASIGAANGMSEEDILRINKAKGKKPKEGAQIRILDENEYHTVVKGDSYGKVAKLYNIKVTDLKEMNGIKDEPISQFKKLIIKDKNTPPN